MKKIFLLALVFLSYVLATEYNLNEIYSKNLLGNYKFIGNTVLEVDKNINYPAIYLNGDDNRVIIYDDGNNIVVKDKNNNIVKFNRYYLGKLVDITKKQKKYQFYFGYIEFKDDYKKVKVVYNGKTKIKVDKKNKEAEWTKFNDGCLEGHSKNNNFCYLKYVNVDNNSLLIDSSSSDLTLPMDSKIVFAGLYWSGLINKNDEELENSKSVLFKINDNNYVSVTVSQNNSHNEYESYYYDSLSSGYVYSAFKNITDLFSNYNTSSIKKITIANVLAEEGINVNIGNFGAWALVVVYEDKNQHYKNITIYNSFVKFYKTSREITINNLLTPLNGKVYSKISYFVSEGDINKRDNTSDHTDKVEISTDKDETYINISSNEDNTSAPNYYTDVMDSTITTKENRNPEIVNNMGIDIDTFDIGKDGNSSHKQIIDNGVKSVNIKITTGKDTFYLNNIVFTTDLYRPNVCYDGFKLYKDGKLVDSNNKLYVGDTVNVEFNIKNMGDEEAKNVYIIDYDNNFTKYVKNSTSVKNVLSNEFKKLIDNDDTVNPHVIYKNGIWNVGIIGDENNIFKPTSTNSRYIATIKLSKSIENEGNISFDFYTDYNYTIGNQSFRYNDYLPKCEEFNNNYYATNKIKIGTFNVVNSNFDSDKDPIDVNNSLNDLYTQIVNKPFVLQVVHLDDDNETLSPYLGIVAIDLIDNNMSSNLQNINDYLRRDYVVFFDPTNITDDVNELFTTKKVEVNLSYNMAVKNGIYRIIYVDGDNIKRLFEYKFRCQWHHRYGNLFGNIFDNGHDWGIDCDNSFKGADCITLEENTTAKGNVHGGGFWQYFHMKINYQCLLDNNYSLKIATSRDNFAIRPDHFLVYGNNEYKRAGEEFNLTIKAVDENNNSVKGYNVNASDLNITSIFYTPSEDEVKQMNKDVYGVDNDTNASKVAYCPHPGQFNIVGGNIVNGEGNITLKYSETGILKLKVAEKIGSEWAKVDEKDTNDFQRLITPSTKIIDENNNSKEDYLLFVPYKFVTDGEVTTSQNSNWIYSCNDINQTNHNMAIKVIYKITAYNKDGEITKNYTKTCFPDTNVNAPKINGLKLNTTFDLFLDTIIDSKDINGSVYVEDNKSNPIWVMNKTYEINSSNKLVREWISPLNFENGVGEAIVYFNKDKNYSNPENEFNITIKDINTSTSWMNNPGSPKEFIGKIINKSIKVRYGFLKVDNKTVYDTNETNSTFRYYYYTHNEWEINKDHTSSIFGDVILGKVYKPDDITLLLKNINKGEENVTISTTHALPYSAKIHLAIPSWLWYHPLAKPYKDPSETNQDCLTHPCLKVTYLKSTAGWAGIGRDTSKYNEKNTTVELNSSKIDTDKQELKKLNW